MIYVKNRILCLFIIVSLFSLPPLEGFCGTPPKKGQALPDMSLTAPALKKDCAYLGIAEKSRFSIKDVDAQLIVLEIIGVYCPLCHKQRPHINRLFHRVNRSRELSGKVKFLGIATGATPMEVTYYTKQSKVPYPILMDDKFLIHKRLSEPRTPYNMVVTQGGQVLFAHVGIIEDMNKFFTTLKELSRELSAKEPTVNQ